MKETWAPLVMLKDKEKGRGQNGERTRELAALFFSRSGSAETLVSPRGFLRGLPIVEKLRRAMVSYLRSCDDDRTTLGDVWDRCAGQEESPVFDKT
jgi:hypothetical protein